MEIGNVPHDVPLTESPALTASGGHFANELAGVIAGQLTKLGGTVARLVGKRAREVAFGAVGAFGIATGSVAPDAWNGISGNTYTRDYVGYTLALKPQRDCKDRLPTRPTATEIDSHLRDPASYAPNERDLWHLAFDKKRENIDGTQWLDTVGNFPMKVAGFFNDHDWMAGSLKSAKGRASFFLEARNNEDIYRGYMVALDCTMPVDVVLVCPYVLGPSDKVRDSDSFLQGRICRRWEELDETTKQRLASN